MFEALTRSHGRSTTYVSRSCFSLSLFLLLSSLLPFPFHFSPYSHSISAFVLARGRFLELEFRYPIDLRSHETQRRKRGFSLLNRTKHAVSTAHGESNTLFLFLSLSCMGSISFAGGISRGANICRSRGINPPAYRGWVVVAPREASAESFRCGSTVVKRA